VTDVNVNDIDNLPGKQEEAACLLALGSKVGEVTEKLGVSRSTIANWKRDDAFRVRFNQIQDDLLKATTRRLHTLTEKAVDRLKQLIESDDERVALDTIKLLMSVTGLDNTKLVIGPTTIEDLLHQDKQDAELKALTMLKF
jgi:transposase